MTGLVILTALIFFMCAQTVIVTESSPKQAGTDGAGRKQLLRKAFVMTVNSGQENEYKNRHQPVWPELETMLREHGVRTYTIFLLPQTRQLFAYVEFDSVEQWNAVSQTEVCKKWWVHMKDIMPSNSDNSPVSIELKEVFHLDGPAPLKDPKKLEK
jgi:L-rhamnose mutarotase